VVSNYTGLRKSRKTVRMSMALVKRPSLFAPLSDEEDDADAENEHGNDVERVCRGHYADLFHQSDHVSDH